MNRGTRAQPQPQPKVDHSLFSPWSIIATFALVAFATTCSIMLLLSGFDLPSDYLHTYAPLVAVNVLLLTALISTGVAVYRAVAVHRPVEDILAFTEAVTAGDLSARIPLRDHLLGGNEFDRIATDLNRMAEELSSVELLRSSFVADVSHEFKTPLAVIDGAMTLLSDPDLPASERTACARRAAAAARSLSDLTTNMLRLNRLEHQRIYPARQRFDLAEQLRTCVLGFEEQWTSAGIELIVDIPDELLVESDPDLLELAWNNLLSNAFKFTDEGGTVTVSLVDEGSSARVSVADTGCGITPEQGRRIFEKFYQADTSRSVQGNGLGLALVKRVIDAVGAEINVESRPGIGSVFTVTLNKVSL